jgi:hypothetical protein
MKAYTFDNINNYTNRIRGNVAELKPLLRDMKEPDLISKGYQKAANRYNPNKSRGTQRKTSDYVPLIPSKQNYNSNKEVLKENLIYCQPVVIDIPPNIKISEDVEMEDQTT